MYKIFYPYVIDSDRPIPYLYRNVIRRLDFSRFEATAFVSAGRYFGKEFPRVREVILPVKTGRTLRKIRTALGKFDLLHTGGYPDTLSRVVPLVKLRNPGVKHVHSLRVDVDPATKYRTDLKRKLVAGADLVTAVSRHTAKTTRNQFGVEAEVVYNGVDLQKFNPGVEPGDLLAEWGVGKPYFLFVGSLQKRKNPADVLKVAGQLKQAGFVLVGSGPEEQALRSKSADLENVVVAGRVSKSKLPALYAQAAGFIFPSVLEGCPNVVLEAMASGTPVLGYEATSMPELVESGKTGYLVPAGQVDELAVVARKLLADKPGKDLGVAARKYVKKHHNFGKIASDYQKIYNKLLSEQ